MIEKISAAFLSSFGRLNNDNLQSIPPAVAGENFEENAEQNRQPLSKVCPLYFAGEVVGSARL